MIENDKENIKFLIEIKNLYKNYINKNSKKYFDEIIIKYLDINMSVNFLESLYSLKDKPDLFMSFLYYNSYLLYYNLKYEYYITPYELFYLKLIINENKKDIEDFSIFKKYKEKFMVLYVY